MEVVNELYEHEMDVEGPDGPGGRDYLTCAGDRRYWDEQARCFEQHEADFHGSHGSHGAHSSHTDRHLDK